MKLRRNIPITICRIRKLKIMGFFKNKIIKIGNEFHLLGTQLAKDKEYSVTMGKIIQFNFNDSPRFWDYGCAKLIASTEVPARENVKNVLALKYNESFIEYKGNLVTLNELYELSNPKVEQFPKTFATEKQLIEYSVGLMKYNYNNPMCGDYETVSKQYIATLPKEITEWIVEEEELTEWNINEPGIGIIKVL